MIINGYTLKQTSIACPEQYDIFLDDEQVGYLRLRHGEFTADYPDYDGKEVYYAEPMGDGCFDGGEREYYLTKAIKAIDRARKR